MKYKDANDYPKPEGIDNETWAAMCEDENDRRREEELIDKED